MRINRTQIFMAVTVGAKNMCSPFQFWPDICRLLEIGGVRHQYSIKAIGRFCRQQSAKGRRTLCALLLCQVNGKIKCFMNFRLRACQIDSGVQAAAKFTAQYPINRNCQLLDDLADGARLLLAFVRKIALRFAVLRKILRVQSNASMSNHCSKAMRKKRGVKPLLILH